MSQKSSFSAFLLKIRTSLIGLSALSACCTLISSCDLTQIRQSPTSTPAGQTGQSPSAGFGDAEAIRAQQLQLVKVPITVTAPVKKMLKYDDKGLPHEKFLMVLSNGTTLLVAHDTKMAPYVPVQPGDTVTVHGEFIWNEKGGLIHWTHHSDTPKHQGGYIDFNGKRYE